MVIMMSKFLRFAFFAVLAIGNHLSDGGPVSDFQPRFAEPLKNLTVPLGRDAKFTCIVHGLGGYRVGWVRADTKAIQAIHTHVITHNPRVSVSHSDHSMWHLTIKDVKKEDSGAFMCQINTDPMISQVSYLEVVIPPDFLPEDTSGDIMAPEGSTVKLTCNARGHPVPSIIWKREDGKNITLKSPSGSKKQVSVYEGNVLRLHKISRADMGDYFCIGNGSIYNFCPSNGVPPSISKLIRVSVNYEQSNNAYPTGAANAAITPNVGILYSTMADAGARTLVIQQSYNIYGAASPNNIPLYVWAADSILWIHLSFGGIPKNCLNMHPPAFHPVIHVPSQIIGAPYNSQVTLQCNVEAFPRAIHFWVKDEGGMIITGDRFIVNETIKSMFEVRMTLIIKNFQESDSGEYHCVAKNSLGDVESVIKLHALRIPGEDRSVTVGRLPDTLKVEESDSTEYDSSDNPYHKNNVERGMKNRHRGGNHHYESNVRTPLRGNAKVFKKNEHGGSSSNSNYNLRSHNNARVTTFSSTQDSNKWNAVVIPYRPEKSYSFTSYSSFSLTYLSIILTFSLSSIALST